ncbi:MAG: IS91 family transposase [Flavisolibacter sp.]
MQRPAFELAQVIRGYKTRFIAKHRPLKQHLSVLHALEQCRTASLGGHVDQCDRCHHLRISYNSCRNRHCPKCQSTNRERWIEARQACLLPVKYFHVVFTLPQELNTYCLYHPAQMYKLLFQCSKETVTAFARDEKHLGAQPGMISILHTWGQNLSLHPHVHMIVPGGGITAAGYWKHAKSRGKYLFPVRAMSIVFKNKFMEALVTWLQKRERPMDPALRKKLYNKEWVVYAKRPFGGAQQVVEYLGRYTHKVAISNPRIKNIADGKVTFSYKDYADGAKQKLMILDAEEFLRRFCMHILPKGFMKIRHYGFLSSRARPQLRMQQIEMGVMAAPPKNKDWQTIAKEKLDFDVEQCPCCKTGKMITLLSFAAHGPPPWALKVIEQQKGVE